MKTKLLTLIILFFLAKSLSAQYLTHLSTINTSTTLCNNEINSITADDKGVIWIGTIDGVSSFNGEDWKTYSCADGLRDNYINSFCVDKQGNKWYGYSWGVSKFDGTNYTYYDHLRAASKIFTDSLNNVWFANVNGAYKFDGTTWTHYNKETGLLSEFVNAIFFGGQSDIWFCTALGVSKFNGSTWSNYLSNSFVNCGYVDSKGNVWFGTDNGISMLSGTTIKSFNSSNTPGLASDVINTICGDSYGNVWIGTDKGVTKFDGTSWSVVNRNDLSNRKVTAIYIDKNGTKWFGTRMGIYRYDDVSFTHIIGNGLLDNNVNCIVEDAKGQKWFGSEFGISVYNGTSWKCYLTPNTSDIDKNVNCLNYDIQENIWVGTPNGAFKFDGTNWIPFNTQNSSIANNNILDIAIDKYNNKWFATKGGISKYDNTTWINYVSKSGELINNSVNSIAIDKNDNKWFGTDRGLSKFDGTTWTNYSTFVDWVNSSIRDIAIDSLGNVWCALYNKDLFKGSLAKYNGTNWTMKKIEYGYDRVSVSVAVDRQNELWAGTEFGIVHYDGFNWNRIGELDGLLDVSNSSAVLVDNKNNKWVCFYNNGIYIINAFVVNFKSNGGSALPVDIINSNTLIPEPVPPVKTGFTFAGWYTDTACVNIWNFASCIIKSDTILYGKWVPLPANNVLVSFDTNGGSKVYDLAVPVNANFSAPEQPFKNGFTFLAWYNDAACTNPWDFTTDVVTANITLYAKWSTNNYVVYFNTEGGDTITPIVAPFKSKIVFPVNPTKKGYTFNGWHVKVGNDYVRWDLNNLITENTTLYANWETNMCSVKFMINGKTSVPDILTNLNSKITSPVEPARTGFTFEGWYKDVAFTQKWDFATDTVTGNTTIYSKWDIATGIENQQLSAFKCYPNPVSTSLNLSNLLQNTKIQILRIDGKLMQNHSVGTTETTIDVSFLPNGIYLLKMNSKEGSRVEKFIKQ